MKSKYFLAVSPLWALGMMPPAHETQAAERPVEEIVVTGSYIKRSSFDSSSPLDLIGQEDIAKTGAVSVAQLIQNLPYNLGSENWPDTARAGSTTGMESINLRGLGINSTLVLVNGRRQAEAPQLNNDGIAFVDTASLVPTIAIERMEVLKDGAAALYGSDAISGVVNFITRNDFEGMELSFDYQTMTEYDARDGERPRDQVIQGIVGFGNDRGHMVMAASWLERNRVPMYEADFTTGTGISSLGSPGTFIPTRAPGESDADYLARVQAFEATTFVVSPVNPAAPFARGADYDCQNVPQATGSTPTSFLQGTGVGLPGTEACITDFFPNQSLIDEERRINLWANFNYLLDPDSNLEFYGEFHAARNFTDRGNSSSYPIVNLPTVPIENPGLRNDFFRRGMGGTELIDDAAAQALGYANAVEAARDNPLVGPMLYVGRPYNGVPEVYTEGKGQFDNTGTLNRDKTHFVAGLRGDLPLDTWTFDVTSTWSQHKSDGYTALDTNDPNLRLALAGLGGRDCNARTGTPGVAPCYFYNPYGSAYLADPADVGPNGLYNASVMFDDLFDPLLSINSQELWVLEGVATGDLFELPAGPLGLAVGAQYRDQSYSSEDSGTGQNFDFSFVVGQESFLVKRDVWATFAELLIPVTDADSAIGTMELSTAVRYEDYGGGTGSTTDPKFALLWMPTNELAIRASFQTSFKAPGLAQLGGSSTSLNNVQSDPFDPGSAQVFIPGIASGNPDLAPEEADVLNAGFSWEPGGLLEGLRLNADYWSFEFTNAIRKESNVSVIDAYVAEVNAGIVNGPASQKLTLNPDGTIAVIRSQFINAASVDSNGIDLSIRYMFDVGDLGTFDLFWNSSHIEEYEFQETEGGPKVNGLGKRNFQTIGAPAPRWRGNWGVDWLRGNHTANLTFRYTDDYEMSRAPSATIALLNNRTPSPDIDDQLTVDVQYSYQMPELFGTTGPTLTVGAINVFNEEPPTIDDGPGYDSKIHDPRGRVVYGRISMPL